MVVMWTSTSILLLVLSSPCICRTSTCLRKLYTSRHLLSCSYTTAGQIGHAWTSWRRPHTKTISGSKDLISVDVVVDQGFAALTVLQKYGSRMLCFARKEYEVENDARYTPKQTDAALFVGYVAVGPGDLFYHFPLESCYSYCSPLHLKYWLSWTRKCSSHCKLPSWRSAEHLIPTHLAHQTHSKQALILVPVKRVVYPQPSIAVPRFLNLRGPLYLLSQSKVLRPARFEDLNHRKQYIFAQQSYRNHQST